MFFCKCCILHMGKIGDKGNRKKETVPPGYGDTVSTYNCNDTANERDTVKVTKTIASQKRPAKGR